MSNENLARVVWQLPYRHHPDDFTRKAAQGIHDPNVLTTYESFRLVDQIATLGATELRIQGNGRDPNLIDVFQIAEYSSRRGLNTSFAIADPLVLTRDVFARLAQNGVRRIAVRFDGPDAESHERAGRLVGSFYSAVAASLLARSSGVEVEVETTFSRSTLPSFERLATLVESLDASVWNVSIAPPGQIQPTDVEVLFDELYKTAQRSSFLVKTTDAKHFRRFILRRLLAEKKARLNTMLDPATVSETEELDLDWCQLSDRVAVRYPEHEIARERESVFVTSTGVVMPDERLKLPIGSVRYAPLSRLMKAEVLSVLRDASRLKNKCGACEFRRLCGGSRARAYQATGDLFEADPLCSYQPVGWGEA